MGLLSSFSLLINSLIVTALSIYSQLTPHTPEPAPFQPEILESVEISQDVTKILLGTPIKVQIPKISLDASIEEVGLDPDGLMTVPKEGNIVGWYKWGTKPGEIGNAVLAGHNVTISGPAVFYNLINLTVGDEINILDNEGNKLIFKITNTEIVDVEAFDVQKVYGYANTNSLNLITCNGKYNSQIQTYNKRLIIYSKLMDIIKATL